MFNKKEIGVIGIILIVLVIAIGNVSTYQTFLYSLLTIFLVIAINLIAKKITSFYYESEIEIKLWSIKKYGYRAHEHFKHAFPSGILFPFIFSAISLGFIQWLACLVFDVKAKTSRAAKRHGLYSFSEMTEYHIALIAASGIFLNLVFAVLGYLFNYPLFSALNINYAFFNLLPFSDLDGNKIFSGSIVLWSFLAVLTLIAISYALFLI